MPARPIAPLWNSLALDRGAAASLQDQIVDYFRSAVLAGRLKAGAQVPSTRALAADHGVARITVVQAYERLVAEGYLASRPGAGMRVSDSLPEQSPRSAGALRRSKRARVAPPRLSARTAALAGPRASERLPLMAGIPALDHFPWDDWARLAARLHRERPAHTLGYGDPRGERALREAIAEYLGASRGVACEADQIIVVAGSQQGIDLTARAVAETDDPVWVEDPGYTSGRAALQAQALRLVPVPVDAEGLDVAAGRRLAPRARLALVSPSHQYPLGATLSLRRRLALLDWAEDADAWILEDDYDGEYRYAGRPLAPLHTLDRSDRVLYLGTFSKVLAPGLRLGYLVVPPAAVDRFVALKLAFDRQAPGLTQLVLARFVSEGRLAAHLRRMRTLYARRRLALIGAIRREAAGILEADDEAEAGLNLVARLAVDVEDTAVGQLALKMRVYASPLSICYAGPVRQRGFVLGFANTAEEQMAPAVRRLVEAVEETRPRTGHGKRVNSAAWQRSA